MVYFFHNVVVEFTLTQFILVASKAWVALTLINIWYIAQSADIASEPEVQRNAWG